MGVTDDNGRTLEDTPADDDEEVSLQGLHDAGHVLVETGSESLPSSYCVSLLQYASKQYDAQLDFAQLTTSQNLQAWNRLTLSHRISHPSIEKENTQFLQNLSTLISNNDIDDVELYRQIEHEIQTYYAITFRIQVTTELGELRELEAEGICYLYKSQEELFHLVLPRVERYSSSSSSDLETLAQSCIQDLDWQNYFRSLFKSQTNSDTFLVRKSFIHLMKCLEEVGKGGGGSIVETLGAVGLPWSEENDHYSKMINILLHCENPKLGQEIELCPFNDEVALLSPFVGSCLARDLKLKLVGTMEEVVMELLLKARERECREEGELQDAIQDTEQLIADALQDHLEKVQELQISENMAVGQKKRIAAEIGRIECEIALNQFRRNVVKCRPKSGMNLKLAMNERGVAEQKNLKFLEKYFPPNSIPSGLRDGSLVLSNQVIGDLVSLIQKVLTPQCTIPIANEATIQFTGVHMYVSECLKDPKLWSYLQLFRENPESYPNQEILVEFHASQSLTMDEDVEHFHGVNLHFVSKNVFIQPESSSSSNTVTIDTSGCVGEEHERLQPITPTATGHSGEGGLQGNPGESGGNIYISASKKLFGYESLNLKSNGGRGGRGQNGGNGSDGNDGILGKDGILPEKPPSSGRILKCPGDLGSAGERGGDSGGIGQGGEGGYGGSITIWNGEEEINDEGKRGENGENGRAGCPGKGGAKGRHGIDRAYIKYSGWFFHNWEKIEGREGMEGVGLNYHNGFWAEGYTADLDPYPKQPRPLRGLNGVKIQANADLPLTPAKVKRAREKCQQPPSTSHDDDDDDERDGAALENELQMQLSQEEATSSSIHQLRRGVEESEKSVENKKRTLQGLHSQRNRKKRKLEELDQLIQQTLLEREEYKKRVQSMAILAENETYKISTPIPPTGLEVEFAKRAPPPPTTTENAMNEELLSQTLFGVQDQGAEGLKRWICNIFDHVDPNKSNVQYHQASEEYLKVFMLEEDAIWMPAALLLQTILCSGNERVSPNFEDLSLIQTIIPRILNFVKLNPEPMNKFATTTDQSQHHFQILLDMIFETKLSPEVLPYLTDMLQKYDPILASLLLPPFYASIFVQALKHAPKPTTKEWAKSYLPTWRGKSGSTSINLQDENIINSLTHEIVRWAANLPQELNPGAQILENFGGWLRSSLKPDQVPQSEQDLLQRFFNTQVFHDTLENLRSSWKTSGKTFDTNFAKTFDKNFAKIFKKNFPKLLFMVKHYAYDLEEFDKLFSLHYKMIRGKLRENGVVLKSALSSTYNTRFQEPMLEKIFAGKGPKQRAGKKEELLKILESVDKFSVRFLQLQILLSEIHNLGKDFDWEESLRKMKRRVAAKQNAKELISQAMNPATKSKNSKISAVKGLQAILNLAEFTASELSGLEFGLTFLQNYVSKPNEIEVFTEDVIQELDATINQFWKQQLHNLRGNLEARFNMKKLEEWKTQLMSEVGEYLTSTKILQPRQLEDFISLKLSQIQYFALSKGAVGGPCLHKVIQKCREGSAGDELETLKNILTILETEPEVTRLLLSSGNLHSSLRRLTSSQKVSKQEFLQASKEFSHYFETQLLRTLPQSGVRLEAELEAIEVHLVRGWRNLNSLIQFHPEEEEEELVASNFLSHHEEVALMEIFNKLTSSIKRENRAASWKRRVIQFIRSVKSVAMEEEQANAQQKPLLSQHFTKLRARIEQVLVDYEEIASNSVAPMILESLRHNKSTISNYVRLWNETLEEDRVFLFWGRILAIHQQHLDQAMNETMADWVDLGVAMEEGMEDVDDPTPPTSNQSLPFKTLLHHLKISSSEYPDATIYPAIQLSLEFMESPLRLGEDLRRDFVQLLLTKNASTNANPSFYTWESYFEELNSWLGDHNNNNALHEDVSIFCDPRWTNSFRKMLIRYHNLGSECKLENKNGKEKLVEWFKDEINPTQISSTGEELDILRHILNEEERHSLDRMVNSFPNFCISSTFKQRPDWTKELDHLYLNELFSRLLTTFGDQDKIQLEQVLNQWNLRQIDQLDKIPSNEADSYSWVDIVSRIFQEIAIIPLPFAEIVTFFQLCFELPLSTMGTVVRRHLPSNYLKQTMLALVSLTLDKVHQLEEVDVEHEIITPLQNLLLRENGDVWKKFLSHLLHQLNLNLDNVMMDKTFFSDIFNPSNFKNGTSQSFLLKQWSKLSLSKWKAQLRLATYLDLLPPNNLALRKKVLELDSKFPSHFPDFVRYLSGANLREEEVCTLIEATARNKWIINSKVLTDLKIVNGMESITQSLKKYAEKYRKAELKGTPLIDKCQGFEVNATNQNLDFPTLLQDLRNARQTFKQKSTILPNTHQIIRYWEEETISAWVDEITSPKYRTILLQENGNVLKREMLAVILRAIQIFTATNEKSGYTLRDTQLAAILLFLDAKDKGIGRFSEIATSEGKTLISAVHAILLALQGNNVYIITSSAVLAEDGFLKMAPLFALFKIGVGNISGKDARNGSKEAEAHLQKLYKNQVLYGDANAFESDHLNCAHLGKTYKGGTDARYLIVDEVDSLLLDKGSNVLYISHTIPELRWLRGILLDIWRYVLQSVDKTAILVKLKMKYLNGRLKKFPTFLVPFVRERLPVWINNAYKAKEMKENVPYILSSTCGDEGTGGKVTIMDGDTGVEQKQTQYSYGLHQFLQLKEGNKLSAESLKAVFISNVGYFSHFSGRIFGITGTIGDSNARKILADLYDVDFFKMARFKEKNLTKETPKFFKRSDQDAYESAILTSISIRKEKKQPTLFICETVKSCKELYALLIKSKIAPEKLFCIYESEKYDEFRKRMDSIPLFSGDIIISTNLAGRGTDLNISNECEEHGLHVVLTYIPPNIRVEKQAFGRTARAGQSGSTEYIAKLDTDSEPLQIQSYREAMMARENFRLLRIKEREVPQIQFERKLFLNFFEKLKEFTAILETWQEPIYGNQYFTIRNIFTARKMSKQEVEARLQIVRNRWSLWLDSAQPSLEKIHQNPEGIGSDIFKKFETFCKELSQDLVHPTHLCKSPSDFVKLAKGVEEGGEFGRVVQILTKGIESEPEFNEVLHYYRGVAYLKLESKDNSSKLRRDARRDLKIAEMKIRQRIFSLQETLSTFQLMQSTTTYDLNGVEKRATQSTQFKNQLESEIQLYSHHVRMFLTPSLGHSWDEETFKMMEMVNQDEAEAKELYQVLSQPSHGVMKPLRLSKKVSFEPELQFRDAPLDLHSLGLSLYEPVLTDILLKLAASEDKQFHESDLRTSMISRDDVLNLIQNCDNFLENVQPYHLLHISYDDFKFTKEDFTHFPQYKNPIGKILGERNLSCIDEKELKDLFQTFTASPGEAEEIVDVLLKNEYLLKQDHFKGSLTPAMVSHLRVDHNNDGNKLVVGLLPKSLQPFHSVLTPWMVIDGRINPQLDTKYLQIISTRDKFQAEDVIKNLIGAGILKEPKVRWSLSPNFGKESKRREELEGAFLWKSSTLHLFHHYNKTELITGIKNVFDKFHEEEEVKDEDEFQKYLNQIRDLLVKSVGSIKTLPNLKIEEYTLLAQCYTGSPLPPELFDFMSEDFDRIPDIKEKIPWWSNGAFYVSLFAILQIAAGITVAVLSGGTLANLSMMLISEGGSDLMYAIQTGMNGSFSWKSYGVHKAFSVACSVVTGGLGGITNGSWATIVAMEVAEEVFKKTVITVGRYAAQGVGTSLINMSIERGLDKLRGRVVDMARAGFMVWKGSNALFQGAKKRLENSLKSLYKASYREGQAERIVIEGQKLFGPQSETSLVGHAFRNSIQRVATFYAGKVSEKVSSALGQGFVSSVIQVWNILKTISSHMTSKLGNPIQKFSVEYVTKLAAYFEEKAQQLKKKGQVGSTYRQELDEQRCQTFIQTFSANLDSEIVEEGLKHFQHQVAEPVLMQSCGRLLDSHCNKLFKGQANYRSNEKTKSSLWKAMTTPNVHYSVDVNTRIGFDEESKSRNNIWDTAAVQGTIKYLANSGEHLRSIQNHCRLSLDGDGKGEVVAFSLNQDSQHLLRVAEKSGIPIIRTFKF